MGSHDHLCWGYDDPVDFHRQLREFLATGLAAGLRVCYVAQGEAAALTGHLRSLDGFDQALRQGAAQVVPLGAMYRSDAVFDPSEQVRAYAAATEQALAAGFAGLRVAAEATPMVRTPAQLEVFTRYEHLVDRYMVTRPFSAMCAYDRGVLGEAVVAQLACMHPNTNVEAVLFRLYARSRFDDQAALTGEVDATSRELLPLALERAGLRPTAGRVVLEAAGLTFIDHRGLLHLADYARRHAVTVVLRTPPPAVARLVKLLGLTNVCVEPAA